MVGSPHLVYLQRRGSTTVVTDHLVTDRVVVVGNFGQVCLVIVGFVSMGETVC